MLGWPRPSRDASSATIMRFLEFSASRPRWPPQRGSQRALLAEGSSPRAGVASAIAERDWLALILLSGGALLFAALISRSPKMAVAVLAGGAVLLLALRAPLTVLVLLIALTAVVPYEIEHPLAIGASAKSPGLLFSDALLLAGLFRAALIVPQMRLERLRAVVAGLMICFAGVVLVQAERGLTMGASVSVVGAEFRRLLGFAVLLIAIPILADRQSRGRLLGWLLALGLALGLVGLAQWTLHLSFGEAGDFGVRQGVALTTTGVGQLQGGLFVYPVAVLLALAALVSGQIRSNFARALTIAVLLLNCVDLLLTFERTFWIATGVGAVLVLLRAGGAARGRVLRWMPAVVALVAVAIALSPGTFTTAEQRLASVTQFGSDNSVRYRVVESEHVLARIEAHPLTGSALGATIFWGRPWEGVPPEARNYSHDGYLWLGWKLGIPAAALLIGLIAAAAFWPGTPDAEPLFLAVRRGCQAALAALLIISATFPVFNTLEITALAGLLLAIAFMPAGARGARAGVPIAAPGS